jgi:CelD/BcsL family acetyltransferase involved in cellulose biosynthesis
MAFSWIERIEDVAPAEWDSVLFASERPSPFLSRQFLVPWARAFAAERGVRIGRWEDGGRARGFVFLCRRADSAGWELMGGEDVADSLDAVVAEGAEAAFWGAFLRSSRDLVAEGPLSLPNLVAGAPALDALPPLCDALGYALSVEETDRSPFVPLPASWESYVDSLGKKERHELRRKVRRAAEALPGMSYRVVGTREELSRDFPAFIALHRKSHADKKDFMDDRMEAFFREAAEALLEAGWLRLALLSAGSEDVAAAFQVAWRGALLLYNSGFDPGMRSASPGLVLVARCIEDAIRLGMREYDFLRGRERYKYDLGGRDRIVFRAVVRLP